jgi:hypothetical protein
VSGSCSVPEDVSWIAEFDAELIAVVMEHGSLKFGRGVLEVNGTWEKGADSRWDRVDWG